MGYNGEIVFAIADLKGIEVNFESNFLPTKIIDKGDIIALGRTALQNQWLHIVKFNGENEYLQKLEKFAGQLNEKTEYVNQLSTKYEKVSINIYIRSEFAELGFSLPSHVLKKLSKLECDVNFEIFSFGMAMDEK